MKTRYLRVLPFFVFTRMAIPKTMKRMQIILIINIKNMKTEKEKLETSFGVLYESPKVWITEMNSYSLLCASPQTDDFDDYDPEEL